MRCNRNQFQKELMRGLESTTGGMKAVELQARLTMIILTVITLTVAGLTMTGLRVAVRTMALPTMDMLSLRAAELQAKSPGTLAPSLPPYSPALAPSLLPPYPLPNTTYPLTAYHYLPTHAAGRQPRLAQRGQVEPLRGRRRGAGFLRGGRVLALPWLGVAPNPNPNPNPSPNPNPNPNQVLALRRGFRSGPRPQLLAAAGTAAACAQVGRRGRRGRQGTRGGALGGSAARVGRRGW